MPEFVVKRMRGGVAETEYIGDGQIKRVRAVLSHQLVKGMRIEVYSGTTRYATRYKGTLYLGRDGFPMWETETRKGWTYSKNVYYVKSNGDLGEKIEMI